MPSVGKRAMDKISGPPLVRACRNSKRNTGPAQLLAARHSDLDLQRCIQPPGSLSIAYQALTTQHRVEHQIAVTRITLSQFLEPSYKRFIDSWSLGDIAN
mgnify:CR=1 FL=1